ncbi:MAG: type II toxin-antitoxin system VapC family toxin [Deltaproteobacteria bacterium]|nr:type II toxin-antitoxin system VapC family toxin [Deltaproteobacteria bacterium]
MKYLIDTHIFLWSLFSPKKIPKPTVQIIKKSENEIFVSCITFWEISIKYSLNKLELEAVLPDELPNFAKRMNFEILNLTAEDAASFYRLPRTSHKDPFDRMIIWQAIREKMILLSKDSKIPAYQKFGLNLLDHSNP